MMRRILLAGLVALGLALPTPAAHALGPAESSASGWYLALGDSLAAGYQPDRLDERAAGYVAGVLAAVRQRSPKTRLVNLSCSGATTVSFLSADRCRYPQGTQLAAAVHFLRAHGKHTRLITIDIGGNDARECISPSGVDMACYQQTLGRVGANLSMILAQLRAASPGTPIVVLNYADPYLAAWLQGPEGEAFARGSVEGIGALNAVIAGAAARFGAPVADVSGAFSTTDFTPVPFGGMTLPLNVVRICQWTWMCTVGDIHPNDEGYAVLAEAVVAVLPWQVAAAA